MRTSRCLTVALGVSNDVCRLSASPVVMYSHRTVAVSEKSVPARSRFRAPDLTTPIASQDVHPVRIEFLVGTVVTLTFRTD